MFRCKVVPFVAVALRVSQDKIVTEVHRVLHPGDEVVHVSLTTDPLMAVEAVSGLNVLKKIPVDIQVFPLRPEEEFF